MLSGLFKKSEEEYALVLDVGSASVGAGIVHFKKGQPPRVLYTTRAAITIQQELDHKRFTVAMISALGQALDDVSKKGMRSLGHSVRIKEIFCVLSSAWSVSRTHTLTFSGKEPTHITKKFIERIVKEEHQKLEASLSKKEYAHIIRGDIEIMDEKIIQTKLNGYEVANPYEKSARDIVVTLFTSISSKKVVKYIEDAVEQFFRVKNVTFHSFSLVGYSAISDIFKSDLNYLFVDVTGEITDISLVKSGAFVDSVSFPKGRNTLIRKVAESANVNPDVALSYIKLIGEKQAEAGLEKDIRPVLDSVSEEWTGMYSEALKHLVDGENLPSKIFMTVDADVGFVFSLSLMRTGPRVVALGEHMLEPFVTIEKTSMNDSFILLETVFLNKVFHLEL